jgi:hypothetical protein
MIKSFLIITNHKNLRSITQQFPAIPDCQIEFLLTLPPQ